MVVCFAAPCAYCLEEGARFQCPLPHFAIGLEGSIPARSVIVLAKLQNCACCLPSEYLICLGRLPAMSPR